MFTQPLIVERKQLKTCSYCTKNYFWDITLSFTFHRRKVCFVSLFLSNLGHQQSYQHAEGLIWRECDSKQRELTTRNISPICSYLTSALKKASIKYGEGSQQILPKKGNRWESLLGWISVLHCT